MHRFTFLVLLVLAFQTARTQSLLSADGDRIVDQKGNEIQLRGMNLGAWFLIEPYMISEGEARSQWQIKRKMIAKGATLEEVENFFEAWRDLFIQQADIDHIASLGFNSVRFPLHFELFLSPHQREVRNRIILDSTKAGAFIDSLEKWQKEGQLFTDGNAEGFRRIDTMMAWCRPHGIYITLDLHAAPGGQGNQLAINDGISPDQYWKGKHAHTFQSITTLFWEKISRRYKSESLIAMYDMLNEPNHVIYIPKLRRFYLRTLQSIRSTDSHLALIEGGLWGSTYLWMRPRFFRNKNINGLVYNLHDYSGWRQPKNKREASLLRTRYRVVPFILTDEITAMRYRKKNNVPIYVGEFGEMGYDWIGKKVKLFDNLKLSWSFWSYKKMDYNGKCESCCSSIDQIDLYSSFGREKCIADLKQRKIKFYPEMINAMTTKK